MKNIEENGMHISSAVTCDGIRPSEVGVINVARLLWGRGQNLESGQRAFDVVVMGDVLYKMHLPELLFQTLKERLVLNGVALLCHVIRAGVSHEYVVDSARSAGFAVAEVPLPAKLIPHAHCSADEAQEARIYLLRHLTL
jgi:predicted nicotinamide N-methyase